jgi:hypothetical protein
MADTARELAGDLAQAACQLLELQKMTRRMPRLTSVTVDPTSLYRGKEDEGIEVVCYIAGEYYDRKAEQIVALGHEGQIDALRVWAHKLGSELNLGDARPDKYTARPGKTHSRSLETAATLPNGLRVQVYTSLEYDPDAPEYHGQRVGEPAIAAA